MGPTLTLLPVSVGVIASALTRGSVIRPGTEAGCTGHQETGSSPASGPRPCHWGSPFISGSFSLPICRRLCRSHAALMGPHSQLDQLWLLSLASTRALSNLQSQLTGQFSCIYTSKRACCFFLPMSFPALEHSWQEGDLAALAWLQRDRPQ